MRFWSRSSVLLASILILTACSGGAVRIASPTPIPAEAASKWIAVWGVAIRASAPADIVQDLDSLSLAVTQADQAAAQTQWKTLAVKQRQWYLNGYQNNDLGAMLDSQDLAFLLEDMKPYLFPRTVAISGSSQHPPLAFEYRVESLAFSPDGKALAVLMKSRAVGESEVSIWDVATATKKLTLGEGIPVQWLSRVRFSADSTEFCVQGSDQLVRYRTDTGAQVAMLKVEGGTGEVMSADSTRLARVNYFAQQVELVDAHSGTTVSLLTFPPEHGSQPAWEALAFSADGSLLAAGGCVRKSDTDCTDWGIQVWNAVTGEAQRFIKLAEQPFQLAVALDGRIVAVLEDQVQGWGVSDSDPSFSVSLDATSVAFAPDAKTLAVGTCSQRMLTVGCVAGDVVLLDAASGAEQERMGYQTGWITDLAYSPDGKTLASASDDHTVVLWKVKASR